MDKSHTEILKDCEARLKDLKDRISALEEELAALEMALAPAPVIGPEQAAGLVGPAGPGNLPEEPEEVDFTDVDLGEEPIPGEETVDIPEVDEEPIDVAPEALEVPVETPAPVSVEEAPPAPVQEDETARLAWRKDRPGIPVKNIRSGISLLDRAMFINVLFGEDSALYDNTISELNTLGTLNEAVSYIREHFPDWDMKSNPVYHFMMSIRKKLG